MSIAEPINKPPALDAKYIMMRDSNGLAKLVPYDKKTYCKKLKDCDTSDVIKVDYPKIVTSVTQRVFDYTYYFSQFANTAKDPSNPTAFNNALDTLMSVFSRDMTLFAIYTNGEHLVPETTNWEETKQLFIYLYDTFFRGYTLHTAPSLRVIPLCNNTSAQAYTSSGQIDYSLLCLNGNCPQGNQYCTDIGYYTFTWRYEPDNVWRIMTWVVDNRIQYVDPPLIYGSPLYLPYEKDPEGKCNKKKNC